MSLSAFAELLERLVFSPGRNAKLARISSHSAKPVTRVQTLKRGSSVGGNTDHLY